MALQPTVTQNPNNTWTYYNSNGQVVDSHTLVLSDPAAHATYDKVMATGLWTYKQAEEYAMKTNIPSAYNRYAYGGAGINLAPNGSPETDAQHAKRLKEEQKALQKKLVAQAKEEVENDWRVRLHLAKEANYLYRDPSAMKEGSILAPLVETDGIIFPYTPEISVQYNADYENYDLTHSNYRGYFYKGSKVQNLVIRAIFTANDIREANYLLASLHFLRSCTKMFYGNDLERGMPPPIVFLTGLGEFQFNNHPCAITMVNWNLPTDVDYIAAGKIQNVNTVDYPTSVEDPVSVRLHAAGLSRDGKPAIKSKHAEIDKNGPVKIYKKATYVPTKIEIDFAMIPIQTRNEVSKEFSLKDYASGKLIRKGFW